MREWFNTGIALFALIVSIVTAVSSYLGNKHSNSISKLAMESAEKANDIALGKITEIPILSISFDETLHDFTLEITKKEVMLRVSNEGNVAISGALVKAYPLNGLVYQVNDPKKENKNLLPKHHRYGFPEAITKNGMVYINIFPLLASILKSAVGTFENPNVNHKVVFNIKVSPIKLGADIAIGSDHYGSKDREVITLELVPEFFKELDVEKMLEESESLINIFSGYDD